ncbi:competence type IV pilus minor pilin ComGD [Virgibacillus proomii]|jgi:competence protein ComGD|uniref:competence type IV pilus minor pilin ComGD n=1 Tax=Virgibacillus proomii TaxID=84407 RepID=UPI0009855BE6|nr:competence type IV pilus minor pilin ComGD [Virgibacillus proomii]
MIENQEKFVHPTKAKQGFTLVEMLIVLSIFMILIGLSTPPILSALYNVESATVIRKLESDVMMVQHLAATTPSGVSILLLETRYYILQSARIIKEVNLPEGFSINSTTSRFIEFDANGNFKNPRSFFISSPSKRYKIIFAFGKGRFRVEEK